MTAVIHLTPGDLVIQAGTSATYVAQAKHPIWPKLQLVIWRMEDGGWSHDALSPAQDVGQVALATPAEREARLRAALLGAGASR